VERADRFISSREEARPRIYACFGTATRSGAVATVSSEGLATMGTDVLLKGEFCLL
jgi:hypothetical protein